MTSKELARVEPEHRQILDRFTSEYPVRVGELARALGVAVRVSSLRTGISGQITNENGHYLIKVNRHEARERQRFTIAHELAHFLLHRHIIDSSQDGITDTVLYRSGAPERIEFEANRLAADIVMPMPLIRRVVKEQFAGVLTEGTIEFLAREFAVSKAAMEIRLTGFGVD